MNFTCLNLLLLFFIIAPQTSVAQYYFDDESLQLQMQSDRLKELKKTLNIKSETTYIVSSGKADDRIRIKETAYDRNGNAVGISNFKKKGKLRSKTERTFNSLGKMVYQARKNGKGNLHRVVESTYNDEGQRIAYATYRGKSKKQRYKANYTFNDSNRLVETVWFYRNPDQAAGRWVYAYHPDGSRKESIQYNRKGKQRFRWTYECNPTGQLAKKEVEVCKKVEYHDDGSKTMVYLHTNAKKQKEQIMYTYDKHENLIKYEILQLKNNKGTKWEYSYDEHGNRTGFAYYRDGKAKPNYSRSVRYDDEMKAVETRLFKNGKATPYRILQYSYTRF